MDVFDFFSLIGGLSLFLFGMNVMGHALERRAGSGLRSMLGRMTTKKSAGLLTGLGVTAVIQSSSATTVMVVGFVNSGLMTLKQAINVIMGSNVGTTVTAWILSLAGIESNNFFIKLFKPSSFTPVLALIGIILYMFCKDTKKNDTGLILLGFATLIFGMEAMSGAVAGLGSIPQFRNLFIMFKNPVLGVLAGALLTAIIQSSSASVGILQALSVTGQISYAAAIPIIMGQNIGTCITAILSSVGANKNAKRAAMVHLSFNIIGTAVCLTIFCIVKAVFAPAFLDAPISLLGIAVSHSVFNVFCTCLMLPMSAFLEKLVCRLVPDAKQPEVRTELDERLLATPSVALERCHEVATQMAVCAAQSLKNALSVIKKYDSETAEKVRAAEEKTDRYEDILGTYLVKLSTLRISGSDSSEAAKILKIIGDFERISDHAVNIVESSEELNNKNLQLSEPAQEELSVLSGAVSEILDLSLKSFIGNDLKSAQLVEPLEQVIDGLRDNMRTRHIQRLQQEKCSIEVGFVWSDLLTDLERTADHCSNIAGCVIDMSMGNLNLHESLRRARNNTQEFSNIYSIYSEKYALAEGLI